MKGVRLHIAGYYGHANFGDDLLLALVFEHLASKGVDEVVISCAAQGEAYLSKWFPKAKFVNPASRSVALYGHASHVLYGGGGTIFEYRERLPIFYRLKKKARSTLQLAIPKAIGTRFASIGLGIGPFASSAAKSFSLEQLKYQDLVFVRDNESFDHALEIIPDRVHLATDVSFIDYKRLAKIHQSANEYVFVIRAFKYGKNKNAYFDAALKFSRYLESQGEAVRWVSYQPDYDMPVIEKLEEQGISVWKWNPHSMTVLDGYAVFSNAKCVITARMHAIYLAGMMGVPVVAIELHPKLMHAANIFRSAQAVSDNPTIEELERAVSIVMNEASHGGSDSSDAHKRKAELMFSEVHQWLHCR